MTGCQAVSGNLSHSLVKKKVSNFFFVSTNFILGKSDVLKATKNSLKCLEKGHV
jgi:hypothetical protein